VRRGWGWRRGRTPVQTSRPHTPIPPWGPMLDRIRIQNFKGWQDTGSIRLAPITVLFGANSAGKTSIPQLLLLLRQTVESLDRSRVLHLGDRSTLVDLGTFEDTIHRHDLTLPLSFELEWSLSEPLPIRDPFRKGFRVNGDRVRFEAEIRADDQRQPQVEQMSYRVEGAQVRDTLRMGLTRAEGGRYDLEAEGFHPVRRPGRAWPLPGPQHFHGFPEEAVAYYQNTGFLVDLALSLQRLLRSVYHVGPLREHPSRLYSWSGEQHVHVGQRGERTIETLLAQKDQEISRRPRARRRRLDELVARVLQEMGLIEGFLVRPIAAQRKEYEVLVRTRADLPWVRLTDVGFGVSQFLPVLVELFAVPPRSIVVLEQPELHLHPRVQADLADLCIDAIRSRGADGPREIQLLVETHSEHFLRRLQRRIAEEELSEAEAALYFVEPEGANTRIRALEVDGFGNIRNWPRDFFGDEMEDLVGRAQAQARRARQLRTQEGSA